MVGSVKALVWFLVAGSALAQPAAERVRREQRLTVTGDPAVPVPEIRTAVEIVTVVLFDAEIQPEGLEVDRARVKLLGSGPLFLILQPVVALGPRERIILRVPYRDGQSPVSAVLALVAHPTEVDTRVEVTRRPWPASACQAELAEVKARCVAMSPTRFVRDGGIGSMGVRVQSEFLRSAKVSLPQQVLLKGGDAYTADTWTVIRLKVANEGPAPWRPQAATLMEGQTKARLRVRSVDAEPAEIAPGTEGLVFVECDALAEPSGTFSLEVREATGRNVTIHDIRLQRPEGAKP